MEWKDHLNGALIPKLPRHLWISWVKGLSSCWGICCLGLCEGELWDVHVHIYFARSACTGGCAWCVGFCWPAVAVSESCLKLFFTLQSSDDSEPGKCPRSGTRCSEQTGGKQARSLCLPQTAENGFGKDHSEGDERGHSVQPTDTAHIHLPSASLLHRPSFCGTI